jgi:hypothetical protein
MSLAANIKTYAAPGVNAIRSNWKPILLIQVCFLVFVVLFYQFPSLQALPKQADDLKSKWGLVYTLGSMWIVSIAIPEIAKLVTGQKENRLKPIDWIYLMVLYGIIGIGLSLFYDATAKIVGTEVNFVNVVKKIALDQFVFSVFFSMPFNAISFLFREKGFSIAKTREAIYQGALIKKYFEMLMTCWMYFGPMTVAIYSLPVELNYPVSMAAQAAWGIIVVSVGSQKKTI